MTQVSGGGLVLLPGQARSIDLGGFDVLVHADTAVTRGAFSLIETREEWVTRSRGLGTSSLKKKHADAVEAGRRMSLQDVIAYAVEPEAGPRDSLD